MLLRVSAPRGADSTPSGGELSGLAPRPPPLKGKRGHPFSESLEKKKKKDEKRRKNLRNVAGPVGGGGCTPGAEELRAGGGIDGGFRGRLLDPGG